MTDLGYQPRYLSGGTKSALDRAHKRLGLIVFALLIAFLIMIVRAIDLGMARTEFSRAKMPVITVPDTLPQRADLVDRNGRVMATSLNSQSLYADPSKIKNPDQVALDLSRVLPGLSYGALREKLSGKGRFVWIKRHITPTQMWDVNAIGEPALQFRRETERVYPQGALASHVLGLVDMDGNGIGGVERYFDDQLNDPGRDGEPLQLSIDVRVQHVMRAALMEAMRAHEAIGATGLVMDVRTGELLALVSLPDFDPNHLSEALGPAQINRATLGVYELGSTFKSFTFAAAFDHNLIKFEDEFDATKPLKAGRFLIRDDHPENRFLTVPEVFIHSSNIGTSRIVQLLGIDRQKDFLGRAGLLQPTTLELAEIGRPMLPPRWGEIASMTISYGHGIAVTPVHLARGISALVNGGVLNEATLVKSKHRLGQQSQLIKATTSRKMRQLLRLAVTHGTGSKADAKGYMVGGKTGTAEKVKADGSGYNRRATISSFIGVYPIDDPAYAVFALLDEPKGNDATWGYRGGGWTAAPVVRTVIERTAPLLGVEPRLEDKSLYQQAASLITPEEEKSR